MLHAERVGEKYHTNGKQTRMKYIRPLLVINLLYCLEILVEVVLRRTDVFLPEPVSFGIFIAKEIVFLTLLYSLTVILREYGEKKSIVVAVYCFMAAITIQSATGTFSPAEPSRPGIGLVLLTMISEICLVYQLFRVRHPQVKTPFRLIGAAFVMMALFRSVVPVIAAYLNHPDFFYYSDLAFLLPPLSILLLHAHCTVPAR